MKPKILYKIFALLLTATLSCNYLTESLPRSDGSEVLPAAASQTPEAPPAGNTAPGEWRGIPIMPDAVVGGINDDAYTFTVQADLDEIVRFYETELTALGFDLELTAGDENAGGATTLAFRRGDTTGLIWIATYADGVYQIIISIDK